MQEVYDVQAKQLAACVTGKKYLGGTNRRTLSRKRKALGGDDDGPSTSKPATD